MAVVGIKVEGLSATRRKLKELPGNAQEEISKASNKIASTVGDEAALRFTALGRQGPLVASTLRAANGFVPTIKVGGSAPLGRNRKPAFKLLYGTEFGSNDYPQFHAVHTGQVGRALYPTVRGKADYMLREWGKAADEIVRKFSDGSDGAEEEIV